MAEYEKPADLAISIMSKNLEQARDAMAKYFQLVEQGTTASPLGATDQAKIFRSYVERNVAASFELSDKLLHAKDFRDVVRIQTEFFQAQLRALTERSKDLSNPAATAPSDATRVPIK